MGQVRGLRRNLGRLGGHSCRLCRAPVCIGGELHNLHRHTAAPAEHCTTPQPSCWHVAHVRLAQGMALQVCMACMQHPLALRGHPAPLPPNAPCSDLLLCCMPKSAQATSTCLLTHAGQGSSASWDVTRPLLSALPLVGPLLSAECCGRRDATAQEVPLVSCYPLVLATAVGRTKVPSVGESI